MRSICLSPYFSIMKTRKKRESQRLILSPPRRFPSLKSKQPHTDICSPRITSAAFDLPQMGCGRERVPPSVSTLFALSLSPLLFCACLKRDCWTLADLCGFSVLLRRSLGLYADAVPNQAVPPQVRLVLPLAQCFF